MYLKYFQIFPDFVRNKPFWIVTAIAVILGIYAIYVNKRTITVEIDFGGQRKECHEENGWFTSNKICYEEEVKRKLTFSGAPNDVAISLKSLPQIPAIQQILQNTEQNKKRII